MYVDDDFQTILENPENNFSITQKPVSMYLPEDSFPARKLNSEGMIEPPDVVQNVPGSSYNGSGLQNVPGLQNLYGSRPIVQRPANFPRFLAFFVKKKV